MTLEEMKGHIEDFMSKTYTSPPEVRIMDECTPEPDERCLAVEGCILVYPKMIEVDSISGKKTVPGWVIEIVTQGEDTRQEQGDVSIDAVSESQSASKTIGDVASLWLAMTFNKWHENQSYKELDETWPKGVGMPH